MGRKKQMLNAIVNRIGNAKDIQFHFNETYSELFEPNHNNLVRVHKVPKFNRREITYR